MPWLLLNGTSVAAADKDMSPEHAACIDKSNGVTDETKIKTLTGGQHDAITRPGFGAFLAGEAARIKR